MKEIIVIENSVDVSIMKRHPNWEYSQFLIPDKQYKREPIPETFAEVQELCERYRAKHDFEAHKNFTFIDEFSVRDDGSIWLHYENIAIQTELTPERQWAIIKSLIGEE